MKKNILCGIALVAGLWSCTEDYTNWASPQSNAADDPAQKLEMAIQPTISSIDFANYKEETVQLFTTNLTKEQTEGYTVEISGEDINHTPIAIDANNEGRVITEELIDVIANLYGGAPVERSLIIKVSTIATNSTASGDVKVRREADPYKLKAKLDAPYIDPDGYYLVGNIDGWSCTRVDAYHMTNNGGDVYDNPEFTVTIEPVYGVTTYEIKMIPAADFNNDGSVKSWDRALSALPGEDTPAYSGKFSDKNAGGNIKFDAVDGAKKYVVKINALETTYNVEAIIFSPYIYEAGVNNSWGDYQQPLYCADGNGTYTGYFYAQDADWTGGKGAFKFRGAADNWDNGNYGLGSFDEASLTGSLIDDGNSGNIMPAPGFYRADVNLADMTFKLTAINSVYVVGSAVGNDWDTGVAMTFNHDKHCWECDATFTEAGVIKFKGNGTWDSEDGNWGGTMDNIINGSNDNIPVTLSGDVHIEFYPLCDTKSYCTITAR